MSYCLLLNIRHEFEHFWWHPFTFAGNVIDASVHTRPRRLSCRGEVETEHKRGFHTDVHSIRDRGSLVVHSALQHCIALHNIVCSREHTMYLAFAYHHMRERRGWWTAGWTVCARPKTSHFVVKMFTVLSQCSQCCQSPSDRLGWRHEAAHCSDASLVPLPSCRCGSEDPVQSLCLPVDVVLKIQCRLQSHNSAAATTHTDRGYSTASS